MAAGAYAAARHLHRGRKMVKARLPPIRVADPAEYREAEILPPEGGGHRSQTGVNIVVEGARADDGRASGQGRRAAPPPHHPPPPHAPYHPPSGHYPQHGSHPPPHGYHPPAERSPFHKPIKTGFGLGLGFAAGTALFRLVMLVVLYGGLAVVILWLLGNVR